MPESHPTSSLHQPLKDDANIPEQYADSFAGFIFANGVLHLTFATLRADHGKEPPTNYRQVTSRLVLPLSCASELHTHLSNLLTDLNAQTAAPPQPPRARH